MSIDNVTFRDFFDVHLVDAMGNDESIIRAAKVSVGGDVGDTDQFRFISYLMRNRHGSPFEHGSMTFKIKAPIFVWREFMRHRIGFSYNEQSGRYMELNPEFYLPGEWRKLVQVGKVGSYEFDYGTEAQYLQMRMAIVQSSRASWAQYRKMLDAGISKEVARMVLPVNIYSTAFVTCNPRSLMSFLSLRTTNEDARYPSFPMMEIHEVAIDMESKFRELFPITHQLFREHGSVAP